MIWIIASIPFWIIASICTSAGVYGLAESLTEKSQKEFNDMIAGSLILLAAGGIVGIFAAKICS